MEQSIGMKKTPSPVTVTTAVASKRMAELIAKALVSKKLIACAHITGPITSVFRWKNTVRKVKEYVVTCTTNSDQASVTVDMIEKLHTYDCPVIEVTEIIGMNAKALKWLRESLR